MSIDRIIFSQIMDFIPKHQFNQCVRRYRGNRRLRTFSCFDQFLCMAYAQLAFKESLRDIEICLRTMKPKLYHAGFRGHIAKSTLAEILQILSVSIFEQIPLQQVLTEIPMKNENFQNYNQLSLFNL